MSLAECINVEDFRRRARRRLPRPIFDYIDGGADDEWSLRNNSGAFAGYGLMPRGLVDVSTIDTRTRVLGQDLADPFLLSPTGMNRLFHHDRELAVARAAAKAGVMVSLSTLATTSLEDVATVHGGAKMFQVYILKDRGLMREFVARCKAAGYAALALTIDTAVAGNRERDHINGMQMPPRFGPRELFSFVAHPYWSLMYLLKPQFQLANVAHRVDALADNAMGLIAYVDSQFDRTVTWKDAEWLAGEWGGPFVIKGAMAADDARRAVDCGASAVMISNHGGRQLDGAPAPVDRVRPMRDAIGDRLDLIVDGGVRRGSDVVKALALGANACSFGRPYLYALAAGGEAGVSRIIDLIRADIRRTMALIGRTRIADITSDCLTIPTRAIRP